MIGLETPVTWGLGRLVGWGPSKPGPPVLTGVKNMAAGSPLRITTWSVKVYFDLAVGDKASFVAP